MRSMVAEMLKNQALCVTGRARGKVVEWREVPLGE